MRSCKKRKWSVTPIGAVMLLGALIADVGGVLRASILAALVHEAGHLLAARLQKIPLVSLRFDVLGARLDVGDRLIGYREEWLLCAAGPLTSLLLSLLMAPLWRFGSFFFAVSCASFLLGLLNLLPVRGFDGGRMAEAFLCRFFGARVGFSVMTLITHTALLLLWSVSVYFLLRTGGGIALFCFSLSVLVKFIENGKIA